VISFEQPIVQLYCNCHAKVDHAVHGKAAGFERVMHAVMQTPCFFSSWSVQPKGALTWDLLAQKTRAFGRSNQEAIAPATSNSGTGWRTVCRIRLRRRGWFRYYFQASLVCCFSG
jgi:hypothetical protein